MTTVTKYYTEAEIREAVELYAAFYEIDTGGVDVIRHYEGGDEGRVIGFRLSRDDEAHQYGDDERHGQC